MTSSLHPPGFLNLELARGHDCHHHEAAHLRPHDGGGLTLYNVYNVYRVYNVYTVYRVYRIHTVDRMLVSWCCLPSSLLPSPPPATTAAAHIKYDSRAGHWSLAINGHKIEPSTQHIMSLVPGMMALHWMVFYFNVILCAFYPGVQNNTVIIPANKEVFTPRPEPVPA